jgi:catechol 2,3-dioxygenase-like lactoylglutathione lyase family enzyme
MAKSIRGVNMSNLTTVELKVFVPSKDFDVSKRFYQDLGFTVASLNEGLAYIRHGGSAFLLQKFYVKEFAENLMMHLLVEDVESWWERAHEVLLKYGLKSEPPKDQPWGIRDFTFADPAGVLWRIGQNTE